MAASDLENRTVVLETKIDYIEGRLEDQVGKLEQLCDGVAAVKEHIAKQNGALPRIEANTALAASRITRLETLLFDHTESSKKSAIEVARETATLSVKQKILWGGIVAIGSVLLTLGAKYLIPFVISLL